MENFDILDFFVTQRFFLSLKLRLRTNFGRQHCANCVSFLVLGSEFAFEIATLLKTISATDSYGVLFAEFCGR